MIIIIIIILIFCENKLYAIENNSFRVRYFDVVGQVVSEEDEKPLVGVTIRVTDSNKGTYTNRNGEFKLRLEEGPHHIVLTMVGMERSVLLIDLKRDTNNIVFRMRTNPTMLQSIVVVAEDPGMRLMRKAIEIKEKQKKEIKNYSYLLYTKFVTQTDTITAGRTDKPADSTIFSIFESYSIGYFQQPDKYYNQIFQRRQSDNVPPQANFVAFGTNLNIFDDFIRILGEEIYTPFHPDAPDFYDFILDTNYHDSQTDAIKRILVNPTTDLRRLFSGYVYLNSETFKPISVELYPNIAVRLPFNTKLQLLQSFHDTPYTAPKRLDITTSSSANLLGIIQPRLDINLVTYATNFQYNIDIDSRIFNNRSVEADKNADEFDSLFWSQNSFVSLTPDELAAYEAIKKFREAPDSAQGTNFFTKYLSPVTRQLNKLGRRPFTGWEDMLVYNSIKGFNPNISIKDNFWDYIKLGFKLGYGLADKKTNFEAMVGISFDEFKQYNFTFSIFNSLVRTDDPNIVRTSTITFASLLTGYDYGDYYYGKGYEISLSAGFGQLRFIRRNEFERPILYKLFFRSEQQNNAIRNSVFSIFRNNKNRVNPPIIDGKTNTLGLEVNWNFSKARRLSTLGFHIGGEISSKQYLYSDFDFLRLQFLMNWRQKTFPLARLDVKIGAGVLVGDIIPQKFFSIESSSSLISANTAMRGAREKEFYGNKYSTLSLEHNWGEIIPGLIRIPNIAEFGVEFINYFNIAYTSFDKSTNYAIYQDEIFIPNSTAATPDRWYYEIGLGLNRLFLFLRTDLTVRLSQVERPRFFFTFTTANF